MRALVILCLLARVAAADQRILVVETRGAPNLPTLAAQLELHVGNRASIVVEREPETDPMTFASRASQRVASGEATVVVWLVPVDGGYMVFASGPWPDRALVELVRIDASLESAEIERTIALKVAGLLDALLVPRREEPLAPAVGLAIHPPNTHRWWTIEVATRARIARA